MRQAPRRRAAAPRTGAKKADARSAARDAVAETEDGRRDGARAPAAPVGGAGARRAAAERAAPPRPGRRCASASRRPAPSGGGGRRRDPPPRARRSRAERTPARPAPCPRRRRAQRPADAADGERARRSAPAPPVDGPFKEVARPDPHRPRPRGAGARARLARRATRATCWRWSRSASAARRSATPPDAARAYGSIIDLFPGRADLRRFAGERLERAARRGGAGAGHRHLSQGRRAAARSPGEPPPARASRCSSRASPREAFEAIAAGAAQQLPGRPLPRRRPHPARGPGPARRGLDAAPSRRAPTRSATRLARARRRVERRARRCASSSTGRPTPTTSTSTSTTPRAATRSTARRSCPRAASSTPTSPPATARSASPSAARPPARAYPYTAAGALLLARADGLRHGQAADHRARRQGRAALRGAAVRGDADGAFVDLGRVGAAAPVAVAPRRWKVRGRFRQRPLAGGASAGPPARARRGA